MSVVARNSDTLEPGTDVDAYVIKSILGAGGFGVTYLGEHRRLGKEFAIKEYFPRAFAVRDGTRVSPRTRGEETYNWGLDRFLQEARALAKFHHRAIVGVSNVFEANGTAYMVLSFEHGQDMRAWLEGLGRTPTQDELDSIVAPLLDALGVLHGSGLLHRDIAPDNIFIRRDGSPVLLDFGAARSALSQQSAQMSAIVKTGYSPPEQYSTQGRTQGPWSDIYAFGATLYWSVTGQLPPESTERWMTDSYVPAATKARGEFRPEFLKAIDSALKVSPEARPRSIEEWQPGLMPRSLAVVRNAVGAAAPIAAPIALVPPARIAAEKPDVATPAAPQAPSSDAPIDLGPGRVIRKRSLLGKLGRGVLIVLGLVILAFAGLLTYYLVFVEPNQGQRSAANNTAVRPPPATTAPPPPANATAAELIAACDRLAGMRGVTVGGSAGVTLETIDAAAAVAACRRAASAASGSDQGRMQTQLAFAYNAAGSFRDAVQALTAASAVSYPDAMALYADMQIDGTAQVPVNSKDGCNLAERAMNAGSAYGRSIFAGCINRGIGGFTRDPARAAELYREAANRGEPLGMILLGIMQRDGAGIPENAGQARKWFEEAEKLGDSRATFMLGDTYETANDTTRARDYFSRAKSGLERRAAANDTDGMRLSAALMLDGKTMPKDAAKAIKLYEQAAARGSAAAQVSLANLYRSGTDVTRDYKKAMSLLRAAADKESADAMNTIGVMFEDGQGVAQSYVEAMKWYSKAAEQGDAQAMTNIANLFYGGHGVTESDANALAWYRRAADLGNASAMNSIGVMTEQGREIKQSFTGARAWYVRAAAKGNSDAMYNLGELSRKGNGVKKDTAEAIRWFNKAADLNNGSAMAELGKMYRDGEGVTQDFDAALRWLRRGADLDNEVALHRLGAMYMNASGVKQDYGETLKYFKRAAAKNYTPAMNDIGFLYLRGLGVTENHSEAFDWFKRAADLGDQTALHNVANLYELGKGVAKNCAEARAYYTKAIEAGYEQSKKSLADLNKSKC